MQTRRDQLQAYRFQNRRALAALVTGQPNVLEPPMRRLTVTTLAGIMIAILIAVVFGLLAVIHPSAGDSWKNESAVILDSDNSSIYIYRAGVLHPVLNYTSAVLAVSGNNSVSRVTVSSSDIAGAKYGYEIGSSDFPNSLPSSDSLINYPMSSCSVLQPLGTTGANARVTLHIGSSAGKKAVPSSQAVLVATPGAHPQEWLLFGGQRLLVGSQAVATSLGLSAVSAVPVGTAFLDSVPQGATLRAPTISGRGRPAGFTLGGASPRIGSLVRTSNPDQTYLVTRANLVPLNAFELALFPGVRAATVDANDVTGHVLSGNLVTSQNPLAGFAQFRDVPKFDPDAATRGGICAVFHSAGAPDFVIPSGSLKNYQQGPTRESIASKRQQADEVDVPATKALLAVASNAPATVLVVSEQGVRYSFADAGLISAFGYTKSDEVTVPPQLLIMIRNGRTGLSQTAALHRVDG